MDGEHITVLLHEAVAALAVRSDGTYIDGTFGRGGHSRLILQGLDENGRLIVFDKDPQAIAAAQALAAQDKRITVVHDGFAQLGAGLDRLGIKTIDGALFDLGLSSPQLDEAARGFSFRFDAPLDMRMNTTRGQTAAEWLNTADEKDIATVIREAGEERFWRQIAAQIVAERAEKPLQSTLDLAEICQRCVRTREKGQHPATRTFQAVRIFINRELDEVAAVLPQAASRLNPGGRLAVIAFHSLEDRIVKQFMKAHAIAPTLPKWAAVRDSDLPEPPLRVIGRAIKPSAAEVMHNPRARSAILRTAERTSGAWRDE